MTTDELAKAMRDNDVFDNALLAHGFTDYMRDYEMIVHVLVGPLEPGTYRYLFRYCPEARTETSVPDDVWLRSLDDRLTEYETGKDLGGYVWGVRWSGLYPGWELVAPSSLAADWSARWQIPMHEIVVKTDAFAIRIVCAELTVSLLRAGGDPVLARARRPF